MTRQQANELSPEKKNEILTDAMRVLNTIHIVPGDRFPLLLLEMYAEALEKEYDAED